MVDDEDVCARPFSYAVDVPDKPSHVICRVFVGIANGPRKGINHNKRNIIVREQLAERLYVNICRQIDWARKQVEFVVVARLRLRHS